MRSSRVLVRSRDFVAMTTSTRKRCVVAYATRQRQYLWTVDLPAQATIADALAAARRIADESQALDGKIADVQNIPWDAAPVGIFGELRERQDLPADGDRIEIYRPLRSDPRERRRERVRRDRRSKPA
jgi:putative ubiquitin-RnfH superfamily antitoxin RatB of RatAB toxin-antitoxin module